MPRFWMRFRCCIRYLSHFIIIILNSLFLSKYICNPYLFVTALKCIVLYGPNVLMLVLKIRKMKYSTYLAEFSLKYNFIYWLSFL